MSRGGTGEVSGEGSGFSLEKARDKDLDYSVWRKLEGKERLLIIITDLSALCVTFCFVSFREEEVLGLERLGTGEQKNVPAVHETLAQEIQNLCQGSQRLPKVTRQSVLGPGHGHRPQPTERGPRLSTHTLWQRPRAPGSQMDWQTQWRLLICLKSPIPRKWWKEHKVMQYCHLHFRKSKAQ